MWQPCASSLGGRLRRGAPPTAGMARLSARKKASSTAVTTRTPARTAAPSRPSRRPAKQAAHHTSSRARLAMSLLNRPPPRTSARRRIQKYGEPRATGFRRQTGTSSEDHLPGSNLRHVRQLWIFTLEKGNTENTQSQKQIPHMVRMK